MKKVYLYPLKGHRVKDPDTLEVLPLTGAFVTYSSYYRRRVRDGSAEIGEPNREQESKPKKQKTTRPLSKSVALED